MTKLKEECPGIDFTTTERDKQLIWYPTLIGFLNEPGQILLSERKLQDRFTGFIEIVYFFAGQWKRIDNAGS